MHLAADGRRVEKVDGHRAAHQAAAGLVVVALPQRHVAGGQQVDDLLGRLAKQVSWQAKQEAPVAGHFHAGPLVVGKRGAPRTEHLHRQHEHADEPGRHLVHLGDRDAVGGDVPAVRTQQVKPHHRVHQPHLGRRLKPLAVAIERARHRRGREEAGGLEHPLDRRLVREGAGHRHGQRRVLVEEGGEERTSDGERRGGGHRHPLLCRTLANQVEVEPVRRGLHRRDQVAQFLRRVLDGIDTLGAGLLHLADQRAQPERWDERGVGVGHPVAGHGVVAHAFQQLGLVEHAGHRLANCLEAVVVEGGVLVEALWNDRKVDLAVHLRDQRGLIEHALVVGRCCRHQAAPRRCDANGSARGKPRLRKTSSALSRLFGWPEQVGSSGNRASCTLVNGGSVTLVCRLT